MSVFESALRLLLLASLQTRTSPISCEITLFTQATCYGASVLMPIWWEIITNVNGPGSRTTTFFITCNSLALDLQPGGMHSPAVMKQWLTRGIYTRYRGLRCRRRNVNDTPLLEFFRPFSFFRKQSIPFWDQISFRYDFLGTVKAQHAETSCRERVICAPCWMCKEPS